MFSFYNVKYLHLIANAEKCIAKVNFNKSRLILIKVNLKPQILVQKFKNWF